MRLDRRVTLDRRDVAALDDHVRLGEALLDVAPPVLDRRHVRRLRTGESGHGAVMNGADVIGQVALSVGKRLLHVVDDANQIQRALGCVFVVGRDRRDRVADVACAVVHEQAIAPGRGTLAGLVDPLVPAHVAERHHAAVAGQRPCGGVVDLQDVGKAIG